MRRVTTWLWLALAWSLPLVAWAQGSKQRHDELIRSAQEAEMRGYILAGLGILLVLAAIPVSIYMERRKKAARQKEA